MGSCWLSLVTWESLTQCVHLRMYQVGNLMHDLFLLVCELFLLTLTLECTCLGPSLSNQHKSVCSYTTKETSMVTS